MENAPDTPEIKKRRPLRFVLRLILWLLLLVLVGLATCVGLVFAYEDEVKAAMVKELNRNLRSEVVIDPANIDLTVIKTFPKCALEFKKVLILEALKKKQRDTLIYAGVISMQFNIKDLWNGNYTVQRIAVSEALCNLHVSKSGEPNYIFWKKSSGNAKNDSLHFALNDIALDNISIRYRNSQQKIRTSLHLDRSTLAGNFGQSSYELRTEGNGKIQELQTGKASLLNDKKIKFDIDLNVSGNEYSISTAEVALNSMFVSVSGGLVYGDSLQSASLDFRGKQLDIGAVLSLLPEKHASRIADYQSDGEFFTTGTLRYTAGKPYGINAEFGIKNATVTYKPKNTQLKNLNVQGRLGMNGAETSLNLQDISATLGSNSFSGNCLITNFADPYINLGAGISTKLEELNAFWPIDTLEYISGDIELKAVVKGPLKEMQRSAFSPDIQATGNASLKNIKTKIKGSAREINISGGSFTLDNRDVRVSDFNMLVGQSDLQLTGELPAFLNYLFDSKQPLTIRAGLKSANLALEDLLFNGSSGGGNKVSISPALNCNIDAHIDRLSFARFEASGINGSVVISDQKIVVKDLALNAMDGEAKLNAFVDASGEAIRITSAASLKNINISKLFYQCNNFGQSTLNDSHLKGFATAEIDFSGEWSRELKANLKSITAGSTLLIERGELMNFKPLESLSKYVELQELKDIKFSSLQSSIDIKNQVISIPRTSIKNSALNIELWGKHTFSNEIDYHIQLLLSELLASKKRAGRQLDEELSLVENDPENRRSVFILMTGTVDNPIIKYDKKGLRQKIGNDIKAEKQNLKVLLKEEFGLFRKDSTLKREKDNKADQKFSIEFGDKPLPQKKPNNLQPKKPEDDDDNF